MKKTINENASSGSTSSGSIASSTNGLHYPLVTRLPKTNFFGMKEYKKKDKKNETIYFLYNQYSC